jgi:hypothetical protein
MDHAPNICDVPERRENFNSHLTFVLCIGVISAVLLPVKLFWEVESLWIGKK